MTQPVPATLNPTNTRRAEELSGQQADIYGFADRR